MTGFLLLFLICSRVIQLVSAQTTGKYRIEEVEDDEGAQLGQHKDFVIASSSSKQAETHLLNSTGRLWRDFSFYQFPNSSPYEEPSNDSVDGGGGSPQLEDPEEDRPHESSEHRLMRHLVGQYDNSVRPVFDANDPVDIRLGLTLTQILDLDEKNQVLTTNVWLEAEWYDQRLNWSASDFGGVTSIRIPCNKLWLPDIVLYNSVDDYTSGYMPSLAMVYNTSRVFWGPVIRFRSSCQIDITFFPFDTQVCKLKMGSWAYTGLQVNVWNSSHTMDLSNLVDNGEWELLGVAVKRNVVFYNCCEEPFPDVTFSIQLRRRTKYYFMNIIIPCIILSFLCLGGFLLPPESGEKITLGLSVLLTITVFMLMVADKMPQTSESISVISIYLMVVLATSCLSVLSSVLVLSIHHQRGRPNRPPLWLRRFCFSLVARLLRLAQIRDTYATEFGNGKQASSNKKMESKSHSETKPCCYSNCRSPGKDGSKVDTQAATARYKIANSSHDGYIEMRTQIRHDRAGCGSRKDEIQFDSRGEYEVIYAPHQCRIPQGQRENSATSCQCYTSRVYMPSEQDGTFTRSIGNTGILRNTSEYSACRLVDRGHVCNDLESKGCGQILANNIHDRTATSACKRRRSHDRRENDIGSGSDYERGEGHKIKQRVKDIERGEGGAFESVPSRDKYDEGSMSESASDSEENQAPSPETFVSTNPTQPFNSKTRDSQKTGVSICDQSVIVHSSRLKPEAALPVPVTSTTPQQPPQNATYRTILRYLLSLVQIRQEQEVTEVKDEELYKEWHDLAFVLDRLLFYLFFFVTLVSTVGILEMRPDTEPL